MALPPPAPGARVRFDVISEGFRMFQEEIATWALSALLAIIVSAVISGILSKVHAIGGIVGNVPADFFAVGMYRMAFMQMRGERISVGDVFKATDVLVPVIVLSILTSIGLLVGFALCIIPGFVLLGLWLLAVPLVADRGLDGVKAMQVSWNTLKPEAVNAALLGFLLVLVVVVGAICCGIGLLVAIPVVILAVARLYRDYFPEAQLGGSAFDSPVPPPPPAPEAPIPSAPAPASAEPPVAPVPPPPPVGSPPEPAMTTESAPAGGMPEYAPGPIAPPAGSAESPAGPAVDPAESNAGEAGKPATTGETA